jgi:hypothetical protein
VASFQDRGFISRCAPRRGAGAWAIGVTANEAAQATGSRFWQTATPYRANKNAAVRVPQGP